MNKLQLGWIDFSKEQRNKVLSVINLLSEPEALDELGIGIIRDAFSDIFFPGTSTIQTRAKYFVLVPYLLQELERGKVTNADKMINMLHEQELDLIDILKKSGEVGVIGENAGRNLKRKPSDIYWNGIRKYDIFTGNKISLHDYARITCLLKEKRQKIKDQGSYIVKDEENDGDDTDATAGEFSGRFWRLPKLPTNWRDSIPIKLSKQEAEFLRGQIILSCPKSLLGFILDKNYSEFLLFQDFGDIEGMINILPEEMKADYLMAKAFRDFIFGAHLRYNIILSEGKNEDVNNAWELWHSEILKHSGLDLQYILYERLKISNSKLIWFLLDCKNAMLNDDVSKLDELIILRERRLKGDKRSKLYNSSVFEYKGWVGISKLQYRLKNGKNILKDIFEGLGDLNAKTIN